MGAHTLGGADEDSGYKGVWVVGEANLFNPNYYKLLLGDTVSYTNVVCTLLLFRLRKTQTAIRFMNTIPILHSVFYPFHFRYALKIPN